MPDQGDAQHAARGASYYTRNYKGVAWHRLGCDESCLQISNIDRAKQPYLTRQRIRCVTTPSEMLYYLRFKGPVTVDHSNLHRAV